MNQEIFVEISDLHQFYLKLRVKEVRLAQEMLVKFDIFSHKKNKHREGIFPSVIKVTERNYKCILASLAALGWHKLPNVFLFHYICKGCSMSQNAEILIQI